MNATKKRKITKKGYLLLGAILICILISLTAFLITQQKKVPRFLRRKLSQSPRWKK